MRIKDEKIICTFLMLVCLDAISGSTLCFHSNNSSVSCGGESFKCVYKNSGSISCGDKSSQSVIFYFFNQNFLNYAGQISLLGL